MDRRAFLGMMAGATSTLAGCAGGHGVGAPVAGEETETERETTTPSVLQTASPPAGTPAGSGTPLGRRGTPPNVCDLPHIERGITPVVEPAFGADWSSVAARDQ